MCNTIFHLYLIDKEGIGDFNAKTDPRNTKENQINKTLNLED